MKTLISRHLPPLLFFISFAVYLITGCPTVYLGDSGELTAAAFCLGIPHNSGYPLYCLLGKLFCLIPIGHVGFRMNLMSAFFGSATVWLVSSLILRMTSSRIAALTGGLVLAFSPVLWNQTICAEVYSLHAFFVALMMRLLWAWDEKRDFHRLLLFVLVAGLSFGNHMQTVMLAPAVFFTILSADRKSLSDTRRFLPISGFFLLALAVYLYLPIRTWAGAAIHWGDPDTLDRFLAHVTGRSHRTGYVFNMSLWDYVTRMKESMLFVTSQYKVLLVIALWGWLTLVSKRWQVFFLLVFFFDFFYTTFLNTISLEVTAFNLPTCIVIAVLTGTGIGHILRRVESLSFAGSPARAILQTACCVVPAVTLLVNIKTCDQSRNYTAYEHAQNIFRTVGEGDTLFIEGDNHFFPVLYGRLVEHTRRDVALFDRHGIIYTMPYLGESQGLFYGDWEALRVILEQEMIRRKAPGSVYYAVFDPGHITLPAGYKLISYCLLHRVVRQEESQAYRVSNVWRYYANESFYDSFERDYLNRQLVAHFYFRFARYLVLSGDKTGGLKYAKDASRIGTGDYGIHFALATFFADEGLFEEALIELEKGGLNSREPSVLQNNWGYYYYKKGEYERAVNAFQKATELSPDNSFYLKNLGYAFHKAGKKGEAVEAFHRSLAANQNQSDIREFMAAHELEERSD